jgi:hypothetical protein
MLVIDGDVHHLMVNCLRFKLDGFSSVGRSFDEGQTANKPE